jgi:valyl-tRNA synthetase
MKIGRKLATKILNVTKFVLSFGEPPASAEVATPVDAAMLARLSGVVADATAAFEDLDYARALELTEQFFWWFCDDYVELVKSRAYGAQGDAAAASALTSLRRALSVLHRLLAPVLPFVTDEVWSWWQEGSVHLTSWPAVDELATSIGADDAVLRAASDVLGHVRRTKTEAKLSQRAEVERVTVAAPAAYLAALALAEDDLRAAGGIRKLVTEEREDGPAVSVSLAAPEA